MSFTNMAAPGVGRQNGFKPHAKPKKPPRWSHQNDLDALKGKNIKLWLSTLSNGGVVGTLIEADQFTVKIRSLTGTGQETIYFKSSIMTINRIDA